MQVKQQWIRDAITAEITVAIALPQLLLWAAARAAALKPLSFSVNFPIGFHVEILRDRDERHLVRIDCIADGKEKRTFLSLFFMKSDLRPTTAEVVKGRRSAVDAGGRARCRNTPVAGIDSPPQIAPAVRWHGFHIQLCHRFRSELPLDAHRQHFHDDEQFNVMPGTRGLV